MSVDWTCTMKGVGGFVWSLNILLVRVIIRESANKNVFHGRTNWCSESIPICKYRRISLWRTIYRWLRGCLDNRCLAWIQILGGQMWIHARVDIESVNLHLSLSIISLQLSTLFSFMMLFICLDWLSMIENSVGYFSKWNVQTSQMFWCE